MLTDLEGESDLLHGCYEVTRPLMPWRMPIESHNGIEALCDPNLRG